MSLTRRCTIGTPARQLLPALPSVAAPGATLPPPSLEVRCTNAASACMRRSGLRPYCLSVRLAALRSPRSRLQVQGSPSVASTFSGTKVPWTFVLIRFTLPGSLRAQLRLPLSSARPKGRTAIAVCLWLVLLPLQASRANRTGEGKPEGAQKGSARSTSGQGCPVGEPSETSGERGYRLGLSAQRQGERFFGDFLVATRKSPAYGAGAPVKMIVAVGDSRLYRT